MTQPKLFISYAHDDDESAVKDFWTSLRAYLNRHDRKWNKWDDKEILVGEKWDQTISHALEEGCNCCLLLLSDLFAKSSYIVHKEWPKTLARYENEGIIFFPVVFGVLEGGLVDLPQEIQEINAFQVYWPTVLELYSPPPENVRHPERIRQCYDDAKERDAVRKRFLSRLASQMNDHFDKYLRDHEVKAGAVVAATQDADREQFVTNASDEEFFLPR